MISPRRKPGGGCSPSEFSGADRARLARRSSQLFQMGPSAQGHLLPCHFLSKRFPSKSRDFRLTLLTGLARMWNLYAG